MAIGALIFDFDGVIADSEALSNESLAAALTALGLPTTIDQSLNLYMGKRWPDVTAEIEVSLGFKLPADFTDHLEAGILERFRTELREVEGVSTFIRRFGDIPRCIASSSSPGRIRHCLDILRLKDDFGRWVYSAEGVERGKPHPDIYLLAAQRMSVSPAECLVIEDSSSGVRAGIAAGMTVIGLCAGSHCGLGHDQKLREAGAHHIANSWADVTAIVSDLL